MEAKRLDIRETVMRRIDVGYAHDLARRMERCRTNEALGFRTAGSEAARQTGELLLAEMERIGLKNVRRDEITVDGWTFRTAQLAYDTPDGRRVVELGAYQTTLVTDGFEPCELVYLGRGEEKDYQGVDVTGKLVLVDINQREEWWINYPVYQAHLKGARALIAVQRGGYGDVDDASLNAQDISGPADAPAFSIARRDADELLRRMDGAKSMRVFLKADTRVTPGAKDANIIGEIPGMHPDRLVLLSAHYDSYFAGFQDDNTAVAMMLGIAKALLESGWKPRNTIVVCAMAAEEWGVEDSCFDWSTGAFEQVFTVHPEWAGQAIADLNFELPALAHGSRARIRCCYEYSRYLTDFLASLPPLTRAYPDETSVVAPIETWSDDFSMSIAGIPSMVNDFTGGSFMETHYHSQFDAEDCYDPAVYRLHHELFTLLLLTLDETCVAPLCFTPVYRRAMARLGEQDALSGLRPAMRAAMDRAEAAYEDVRAVNDRYARLLRSGAEAEAEALYRRSRSMEKDVLRRFRQAQDELTRVDWSFEVRYPQEIVLDNIACLTGAISALENGDANEALRRLYHVDNNAYAFTFDEAVYNHFSDYVFSQPPERLKWGYHRVMPHANLYGVVKSLLKKRGIKDADFGGELENLHRALKAQNKLLRGVADGLSALARA